MVMVQYRRRGIVEDRIYTAVVYPADDGWRWVGHATPADAAGSDYGPVMASGGPFESDTDAAKEAERWFRGIPKIFELSDSDIEQL